MKSASFLSFFISIMFLFNIGACTTVHTISDNSPNQYIAKESSGTFYQFDFDKLPSNARPYVKAEYSIGNFTISNYTITDISSGLSILKNSIVMPASYFHLDLSAKSIILSNTTSLKFSSYEITYEDRAGKHVDIDLIEVTIHMPENEIWNLDWKIPKLTLVLDKIENISPTVKIHFKNGTDHEYLEFILYMQEYDAHLSIYFIVPIIILGIAFTIAFIIMNFIENNRVWHALDWKGLLVYYFGLMYYITILILCALRYLHDYYNLIAGAYLIGYLSEISIHMYVNFFIVMFSSKVVNRCCGHFTFMISALILHNLGFYFVFYPFFAEYVFTSNWIYLIFSSPWFISILLIIYRQTYYYYQLTTYEPLSFLFLSSFQLTLGDKNFWVNYYGIHMVLANFLACFICVFILEKQRSNGALFMLPNSMRSREIEKYIEKFDTNDLRTDNIEYGDLCMNLLTEPEMEFAEGVDNVDILNCPAQSYLRIPCHHKFHPYGLMNYPYMKNYGPRGHYFINLTSFKDQLIQY